MCHKVISRNIFKIIKLDTFSFIKKNNINRKYKNIEISKINNSFCFLNNSKKIIPKNETIKIEPKIDKPKVANKILERINNLNKNSNNQSNINNTDNNIIKNEIKPKEKEETTAKKNMASDRMNRAMNRLKRKNQSKVEPDVINPDSFGEVKRFRAETVSYKKSGKIMNIAKQLERQMTQQGNIIEETHEENKNESSKNILDVISTQPTIKKKKMNKINFNYDE